MEIVRQLGKFVQKISVGLRASDCRFVGDVLLGVVQRGSTMLTEIGRALKEPCKLKHTEKRLSRMASTKYFDDERLLTNYLSEVGRLTASKLPYVAVDLTDIAKPSGKAMEGLGLVRDGSSSKKGGLKKGGQYRAWLRGLRSDRDAPGPPPRRAAYDGPVQHHGGGIQEPE